MGIPASDRRSITGKSLWAGSVLAEELRGLSDDEQLGLEFADATPRCPQLRGLGRADPGDLAAVDASLLDPLRQRDRMDAQLCDGPLLFLAGPDQDDVPSAELGGIGTWHGAQPLDEAVT